MKTEFRLDAFLPYRINRLAEQVSSSLATVYAQRFDISIAQWRILATLQESPGLSAKTVAAMSNMDKVRVSRAVGDLEQRGLVERKTSPGDARVSELRLTRAGKGLFARIAPLALAWEENLLGSFSARQKNSLMGLLERLEQDLNTIEAGPGAEPTRPEGL